MIRPLYIAFAVLTFYSPVCLFAAPDALKAKCSSIASKTGPFAVMDAMMSPQQGFRDESLYWSPAEYKDYLDWVHASFARPSLYGSTNDLARILLGIHMTTENLARVQGRVLLAGEGPTTDQDGLYSAFEKIRGSVHQPGAEVVALDLGYRGKNGGLVEGTVTRMPFKDSSFRTIISYMVAHHLRAGNLQQEFVAEVIRVLQPGGEARLGPFLDSEIQTLKQIFGWKVRMETLPHEQNTHILILKKN